MTRTCGWVRRAGYCASTAKAFRSPKKMSCAETAESTRCSRTGKEISGSEVREGWAAFGTVRSSLIHPSVILVSNTTVLSTSIRRAALGSRPLKAGCIFSRMDAFNRLQRYHPTRRSEEHTSELQSHLNLVCRLLLEKKKPEAYTTFVSAIRPAPRT